MTFTAYTTPLGLRLLLSPKVPLLLLTTNQCPPTYKIFYLTLHHKRQKKPHSTTIPSLHSLSARLAILLWAPIAVSRCIGQIQAWNWKQRLQPGRSFEKEETSLLKGIELWLPISHPALTAQTKIAFLAFPLPKYNLTHSTLSPVNVLVCIL